MTYALNNKINQHLQCVYNIYIYIYINVIFLHGIF